MPGISRTKHFVGIVIESDGEGGEDKAYCENCLKVGMLSRLKNRLYLDDQGKSSVVPPPDADEWLQCWKCGDIIASREAKKEGTISGISGIEPIDNPHDFGKAQVLGLDDRKQRHQKVKRKQSRKKLDDAEVQKELDRGSELVRYIKTTNSLVNLLYSISNLT